MYSCNCLNVIIESETDDFQEVTTESLNLTEEERLDIFFKQDIRQVSKLSRISKEHSGLVASRNIGNWIMHQCLNCDVHTHAIHRDRGAACVLVSWRLSPGSTVEALRNSDHYSNIFNIVVPTERLNSEDSQPENLPPDVQLALGGLKQRIVEVIKKETSVTEDRVRQYTEAQHEALEKFRKRAQREHKALSRVILEKRYQPASLSNNYSMASPPDTRLSIEKVPVLTANNSSDTAKVVPKLKTVTRTTPKQKKPLKTRDSEGLFQFEAEEDAAAFSSEIDESENEGDQATTDTDKEETGAEGRRRFASMNVAKSLPVTIPTFMSAGRNPDVDEDHDDLLQHADEHPSDIAASIKALAKSVHGDTVFGDLPRPRFSTQI